MQNSKLVKIMRTLDKGEFKYLGWFVKSDYFNTDKNLVRLYRVLGRHYPEFENKGLERGAVFGKVFPGTEYSDIKMRNLMSKMTKTVERYLIILELEKEPMERDKLLVKSYGRRNLYEYFEKNTNNLISGLGEKSIKHPIALIERLLLSHNYYYHPQTSKVNCFDILQIMMEDLDAWYFSEKLQLASDLKVFENIVSKSVNVRLKDEIINELESGMGKKYPYLNLYQQILSIFETGTTIKNFKKKLDVFFNIVDSLSTENKQFGLFHLLNYAINESNKGLYEFRTVILDIYKLGLEKEILLERGVISDGTFINIASVASGLGEYNWTLGFIKKYSPKLNSDMRGEAVTLSLAFLNFNKKDHGKATKLLLNYPFKEFNNNIIAKFLLVRSYFELFEEDASYYDLLNSYIVSFNKFIRRERNIPKNRKAWYLNSLSILSKFSKAILNSEIKDMKHKLLDEIEAKPTAIKGWLLEKINTI